MIRDTELLPLKDLGSVHQAIENANGLPNVAYQSSDVFAIERDSLMANTWAAIAFSSDLPNRPHALPVDFMGVPLLIMRDRENGLSVFHNVCSHRGMPLLDSAADIDRLLTCRYHCWSYDTCGRLKATPHIGGVGVHEHESFDRSQHGLKPVRFAVWLGVVFVNLSGDAPDFEERIAGLAARWQPLLGDKGLDQVAPAADGSHLSMEINANWKLAVENYCESYHLPWVHPDLNSYSPLDQHYNILTDNDMSGQGCISYKLSAVAGTQLPRFPEWPEHRLHTAEYISFYPNVLLGLQADHIFVVLVMPLSNSRILERFEISYVGSDALSEPYEACRAAVLRSWKQVFQEDVFALEGMQRGRASPAFKGGAFSMELDKPTHNFHKWVAAAYERVGV